MNESSDLKTSTEPVQTEPVTTNGNDESKENSTKSTPSTDKPEKKKSENNVSTANCYWYVFLLFMCKYNYNKTKPDLCYTYFLIVVYSILIIKLYSWYYDFNSTIHIFVLMFLLF